MANSRLEGAWTWGMRQGRHYRWMAGSGCIDRTPKLIKPFQENVRWIRQPVLSAVMIPWVANDKSTAICHITIRQAVAFVTTFCYRLFILITKIAITNTAVHEVVTWSSRDTQCIFSLTVQVQFSCFVYTWTCTHTHKKEKVRHARRVWTSFTKENGTKNFSWQVPELNPFSSQVDIHASHPIQMLKLPEGNLRQMRSASPPRLPGQSSEARTLYVLDHQTKGLL